MLIFKYEIPTRFNVHFPVYISKDDIIGEDLDNPSQYSLEIYFNKIITSSNFITYDMNAADIIYLPIYTFLLGWRSRYLFNHAYIKNSLNVLLTIIDKINKEYPGKKIMFVYSDVIWGVCKSFSTRYENIYDENNKGFINDINFPNNVYIITLERVVDKYLNNQISIPYIPNKLNKSIDISSNKEDLISYIGRYRKEVEYFTNIKTFYIEIKYNWKSSNNIEMHKQIDQMYKCSHYSLQPHGDKQTRRGFYNSLLCRCIPVIFENNVQIYKEIFQDYIKIEDICVIIKYNEIQNIESILIEKLGEIPNKIKMIDKIYNLISYSDNSILNYTINNIKNYSFNYFKGFYINLKYRDDRKKHIMKNVLTIDFFKNIMWFEAIKNDNGSLGCALSHINVLSQLKNKIDDYYFLILEDDFEITNENIMNNFERDLNDFILSGVDWDIINLISYRTKVKRDTKPIHNFLKTERTQTTSGYIINRCSLDKLINLWIQSVEAFQNSKDMEKTIEDYSIDQKWNELENIYVYNSIFAGQLLDYSDITNRDISAPKNLRDRETGLVTHNITYI
tara:strand:- start:1071 stop:2759 length:1689 start_codon:yes stop_codon:yes gene_type:complete